MRRLALPKSAKVNRLAFAPDGSRLAAACQNASVRVWSLGANEGPAVVLRGRRGQRSWGLRRGARW